MDQNFTRIKVLRVSRKNSLKRPRSDNRNLNQHRSQSKSRNVRTSKSNITSPTSSNSARFPHVSVSRSALTSKNAKQNNINSEEQKNQIITTINKEKNQSNLSDFDRDFPQNNSITNSTTRIQRSLSGNQRITPIDNQNHCKKEFTLDISERDRKKRKKNRYTQNLCKLCLCIGITLLLLGGIIAALVYAIKQSQNSASSVTTTASSIVTTTQNSACTVGGTTCSSPMFSTNRTGSCISTTSSFTRHTCCFRATSTQLTIEFKLIDETGQWYIDDVSMTQGNGELITNGGFESNFTGWTISSVNPLLTPIIFVSMGGCKFGTACLTSEATSTHAFDSIKQTVNVIQGQNINISFYWLDDGGSGPLSDRCESIVTLTP